MTRMREAQLPPPSSFPTMLRTCERALLGVPVQLSVSPCCVEQRSQQSPVNTQERDRK